MRFICGKPITIRNWLPTPLLASRILQPFPLTAFPKHFLIYLSLSQRFDPSILPYSPGLTPPVNPNNPGAFVFVHIQIIFVYFNLLHIWFVLCVFFIPPPLLPIPPCSPRSASDSHIHP